jgi:predicted NAD/FAD-dependent oxidoreductase
MEQRRVVIVGAGPAGVATGCQLAWPGCAFGAYRSRRSSCGLVARSVRPAQTQYGQAVFAPAASAVSERNADISDARSGS